MNPIEKRIKNAAFSAFAALIPNCTKNIINRMCPSPCLSPRTRGEEKRKSEKIVQSKKHRIGGLFMLIGMILAILPACTSKLTGRTGSNPMAAIVIEKASAQEMYEMFSCPCCGKPISTNCCASAKERMTFADGLAAAGTSKSDAIAAYVKKFGLNSFIDETEKAKYREILIAEAPDDRPILALSPAEKDLGDVSQKAGKTSTLFEISNEGQTDLVIDKLETSCGCTSASIVFNGEEGPVFGMPGHGVNENIPEGWNVRIAPGEKAELKVYYDPYVHKEFRGAAMREIYVSSNDPIDVQKKVTVRLKQVD